MCKKYSYEEFLDDLQAMSIQHNKEWVRPDYHNIPSDAIHIGKQQSFEANTLRLIDYFAKKYSDSDTCEYNRRRFSMAYLFITEYHKNILDAGLAYQETQDAPIIFGQAVIDELYAVFANADHWLTTPEIGSFLRNARKRAKSIEG